MFAFIDYLLKLLSPRKGRSSRDDRPPKYNVERGMVTECPTCGYKADHSEFMQLDEHNDRCPRCGEDTPTYEV